MKPKRSSDGEDPCWANYCGQQAGDIRRCFPRLRYCGDCSHVIMFFRISWAQNWLLCYLQVHQLGQVLSYCRFFFGWLLGCGYFELLHGQIGMLDFNAMEMRCSRCFNMNFSKIPQSLLVNIYHHHEHQSIDPIATTSKLLVSMGHPFPSHPPNPRIFDSGSSTCGA